MQRRRFIKILAASSTSLSLSKLVAAAAPLQPVQWRGYTLGAEGSFTLYSEDKASAQAALKQCFDEIRRLESIFSLYDPKSEISQLNQNGILKSPSQDWLRILKVADHTHRLTEGLFDPTIQPIWKAYEQYFQAHPDAKSVPTELVDQVTQQCSWEYLNYNTGSIRFERPETQLTLNGIAQGYITDRVSEILKDAGYANVLIELGETRALGPHPENRPWALGIKNAAAPHEIHEVAEIENQALATSGSYGSPFSTDGSYHHLIHPKTGQPSTRWKSLSVIAPTATEADALSTGLSFATENQIDTILSTRTDLKVLKQA